MMLHHRGGVSFLSFEDIVLIQREERSTVLYTADGSRYVTGDSLGDMEERLPPDLFFRCHKSYIVNMRYIDRIDRKNVLLQGGRAVPISRSKQEETRKRYLLYRGARL